MALMSAPGNCQPDPWPRLSVASPDIHHLRKEPLALPFLNFPRHPSLCLKQRSKYRLGNDTHHNVLLLRSSCYISCWICHQKITSKPAFIRFLNLPAGYDQHLHSGHNKSDNRGLTPVHSHANYVPGPPGGAHLIVDLRCLSQDAHSCRHETVFPGSQEHPLPTCSWLDVYTFHPSSAYCLVNSSHNPRLLPVIKTLFISLDSNCSAHFIMISSVPSR